MELDLQSGAERTKRFTIRTHRSSAIDPERMEPAVTVPFFLYQSKHLTPQWLSLVFLIHMWQSAGNLSIIIHWWCISSFTFIFIYYTHFGLCIRLAHILHWCVCIVLEYSCTHLRSQRKGRWLGFQWPLLGMVEGQTQVNFNVLIL